MHTLKQQALRKCWLPQFPPLAGYYVYTRKVKHPSDSFNGFFVWETGYTPSLDTMFKAYFGTPEMQQMLREQMACISVLQDLPEHSSWTGSQIIIPFSK